MDIAKIIHLSLFLVSYLGIEPTESNNVYPSNGQSVNDELLFSTRYIPVLSKKSFNHQNYEYIKNFINTAPFPKFSLASNAHAVDSIDPFSMGLMNSDIGYDEYIYDDLQSDVTDDINKEYENVEYIYSDDAKHDYNNIEYIYDDEYVVSSLNNKIMKNYHEYFYNYKNNSKTENNQENVEKGDIKHLYSIEKQKNSNQFNHHRGRVFSEWELNADEYPQIDYIYADEYPQIDYIYADEYPQIDYIYSDEIESDITEHITEEENGEEYDRIEYIYSDEISSNADIVKNKVDFLSDAISLGFNDYVYIHFDENDSLPFLNINFTFIMPERISDNDSSNMGEFKVKYNLYSLSKDYNNNESKIQPRIESYDTQENYVPDHNREMDETLSNNFYIHADSLSNQFDQKVDEIVENRYLHKVQPEIKANYIPDYNTNKDKTISDELNINTDYMPNNFGQNYEIVENENLLKAKPDYYTQGDYIYNVNVNSDAGIFDQASISDYVQDHSDNNDAQDSKFHFTINYDRQLQKRSDNSKDYDVYKAENKMKYPFDYYMSDEYTSDYHVNNVEGNIASTFQPELDSDYFIQANNNSYGKNENVKEKTQTHILPISSSDFDIQADYINNDTFDISKAKSDIAFPSIKLLDISSEIQAENYMQEHFETNYDNENTYSDDDSVYGRHKEDKSEEEPNVNDYTDEDEDHNELQDEFSIQTDTKGNDIEHKGVTEIKPVLLFKLQQNNHIGKVYSNDVQNFEAKGNKVIMNKGENNPYDEINKNTLNELSPDYDIQVTFISSYSSENDDTPINSVSSPELETDNDVQADYISDVNTYHGNNIETLIHDHHYKYDYNTNKESVKHKAGVLLELKSNYDIQQESVSLFTSQNFTNEDKNSVTVAQNSVLDVQENNIADDINEEYIDINNNENDTNDDVNPYIYKKKYDEGEMNPYDHDNDKTLYELLSDYDVQVTFVSLHSLENYDIVNNSVSSHDLETDNNFQTDYISDGDIYYVYNNIETVTDDHDYEYDHNTNKKIVKNKAKLLPELQSNYDIQPEYISLPISQNFETEDKKSVTVGQNYVLDVQKDTNSDDIHEEYVSINTNNIFVSDDVNPDIYKENYETDTILYSKLEHDSFLNYESGTPYEYYNIADDGINNSIVEYVEFSHDLNKIEYSSKLADYNILGEYISNNSENSNNHGPNIPSEIQAENHMQEDFETNDDNENKVNSSPIAESLTLTNEYANTDNDREEDLHPDDTTNTDYNEGNKRVLHGLLCDHNEKVSSYTETITSSELYLDYNIQSDNNSDHSMNRNEDSESEVYDYNYVYEDENKESITQHDLEILSKQQSEYEDQANYIESDDKFIDLSSSQTAIDYNQNFILNSIVMDDDTSNYYGKPFDPSHNGQIEVYEKYFHDTPNTELQAIDKADYQIEHVVLFTSDGNYSQEEINANDNEYIDGFIY